MFVIFNSFIVDDDKCQKPWKKTEAPVVQDSPSTQSKAALSGNTLKYEPPAEGNNEPVSPMINITVFM